jgi:outer membrane protein OmpA-like peptidoglycan-associated protein
MPSRPIDAVLRLLAPVALCAAVSVSAAPAAPPRIPLCPGLTVVTAVSQTDGDYESIKRIESVSGESVRLRYSAQAMVKDPYSSTPPKLVKTDVYRSVTTQDLASAKMYEQQFYAKLPEAIPGTTAIGTSKAVLQDLKTKGQAEIAIFIAYVGEPTLKPGDFWNLFNNKMVATIKRVEPQPVMLPVIVNDVATQLPAIHATGNFQGDKTEFYFLDDPANPLTLKYRYGIDALTHVEGGKIVAGGADGRKDRDALQVIKISSHCENAPTNEAAASAVEESLAKTGKAEIYDIYFDFNSATIRPESEPSLKEIATVLQRHADWKLDVSGHTDAIGGDKANLELSRQRAAAVKDALASRYHVNPLRLTTSGYGAARPQDTNDTLEGRARNRRVELVKQ